MENNRKPKPGQIYKHFKNNLYQIIAVAIHTETKEEMVVYQALYGDFGIYVRPIDMFLSKVDHDKYPEVQQIYRFQLISKEDLLKNATSSNSFTHNIEESHAIENELQSDKMLERDNQSKDVSQEIFANIVQKQETVTKDQKALFEFLDADTYQEKLNLLISMKNDMTDLMLDNLAVCLDFVPSGDALEDRYLSLVHYIKMKINYEGRRS